MAEDESSYDGGIFDFALTSPPYFDLESYGDEKTQSAVRYTVYDRWVERFLRPMLLNVYNHLAVGAAFCVNVSDSCGYPLESDTLSASADIGFLHEHTYRMPGYRIPGMSSINFESIFVLRKGA